ncbi:MAG: regulatory protein [Cyclobacteriaceae bacterium]|jgi:regulatory protein
MNESSPLIKQAFLKMAKYCAMGEKSSFQVGQKLTKYGLSEVDKESIIDRLTNEGFLSEERFSTAFTNDKFQFNKWGKIRIRMELKHHRISEQHIELALSQLNEASYKDMLAQLIQGKWSLLASEEQYLKRKKKTLDFVIRKGFEPSLCFNLFDEHVSS